VPRLRLPHAITLLVACTILAALLTYVLPAGQFDRRDDPETGRRVVVAGTYHRVPAHPIGPFQTMVAIPDGIIDAASVIAFVFLVGAAFTVVDQTGALRDGIEWLARRLGDRQLWAIPIVSLAFAAGGALEHMQEEIVGLVPVLLVLARRLGFDDLTAVMMSIGAAAVGAAFSPIDPFSVGIAQKVAHVTQLSGGAYRSIFLAIALVLWIAGTMRHARRTHQRPPSAAGGSPPQGTPESPHRFNSRRLVVLGVVALTFVIFVYGVAALGWDFDQEAALFFIMAIVTGLIGGLGVGGTADAFIDGLRSMAYAALLIGFARSISVVMEQGLIIDTVVQGLAAPLAGFPVAVAGVGMMVVQAAIHVPVPSTSGQAVLTLPVFAPVADLIHMSRQVAVLAYQYGAGICELITPTNGALMAILAAAGLRYEQWLRSTGWLLAALVALGAASIVIAVAVGLR
jgi:uncharacterized ion transporter superfamily protein YfcC